MAGEGTRLAGVIGWPVAHSLSPILHRYWFERYAVDGLYVPLPVQPGDLALAFEALPRLGFRGWNVTIPHKEEAFALVDRHDPAATRMRAVNTVLVQEDGHLLGCNTDGQGFLANLEARASGWRQGRGPVVVLGAGGAARAVAVALLEGGVEGLRLINRTRARAEALVELLSGLGHATPAVVPWEERASALAEASLCVNTTSLGMRGQPPLDLSLEALPLTSPVVDLVYAPLETPLLLQARLRGHATVDGLGMLLHQAVPGFRHWGGCEPEVDEGLRHALLGELARRAGT